MKCIICGTYCWGEIPHCNNIHCIEEFEFKKRVLYSKKEVKRYLKLNALAIHEAEISMWE